MNIVQPFDIGKPSKEAPAPRGKLASWIPIWEAVKKLGKDKWLPVSVESIQLASSLYLAAKTHRTLKLEARRRGKTVHIKLVGIFVVK
ncbi:hypothetical protein LCGC14_1461550 [marine sediment metagenome]|uniref:Uncharacterized protein n=1 Tax=marine sediment metagenome TaxID=412755 RepID=A0A0F9K119_9ZZZZ